MNHLVEMPSWYAREVAKNGGNQCDGCLRRLPINSFGNHYEVINLYGRNGVEVSIVACTKERYFK